MFLRRLLKKPDMGSWVTVMEMFAALATLVATLMALNVVPSPFGSALPLGTVSGVVTDANSGKPIPEATVQVIDNTTQVIATESVPDAGGKWSEKVKPGSYTVKAVSDGYRPGGKSVTVAENKIRVVCLEMLAQSKEASQAEAESGSAPVRTVETRIVTAGDSAPAPDPAAARSSSAPAASASAPAAPSGANKQVEKLIDAAKSLNNKDDYDAALEKLAQASDIDSTDGRIYALAIRINLNKPDNLGRSDAKDWYKDGIANATKHKDQIEAAYR